MHSTLYSLLDFHRIVEAMLPSHKGTIHRIQNTVHTTRLSEDRRSNANFTHRYNTQNTLHNTQYTHYTQHSTKHTVHCTLYSLLDFHRIVGAMLPLHTGTIHRIQNKIHRIQYTEYRTQYTVHSTHNTVHNTQ